VKELVFFREGVANLLNLLDEAPLAVVGFDADGIDPDALGDFSGHRLQKRQAPPAAFFAPVPFRGVWAQGDDFRPGRSDSLHGVNLVAVVPAMGPITQLTGLGSYFVAWLQAVKKLLSFREIHYDLILRICTQCYKTGTSR